MCSACTENGSCRGTRRPPISEEISDSRTSPRRTQALIKEKHKNRSWGSSHIHFHWKTIDAYLAVAASAAVAMSRVALLRSCVLL
jgi:hypothetical protein